MIARHLTSVLLVLALMLVAVVAAQSAVAQEETTGAETTEAGEAVAWDDVTDPRFVTQETDALNAEITRISEEITAAEQEIQRLRDNSVANRDEIDALQERERDLQAEGSRAIEDLIEARTNTVEDLPVEGTPDEQLETLRDKRDAYEALDDYADRMLSYDSPMNDDQGYGPGPELEDVEADIAVLEAQQEAQQDAEREAAESQADEPAEQAQAEEPADAPSGGQDAQEPAREAADVEPAANPGPVTGLLAGGTDRLILVAVAGFVVVMVVIGSLRGGRRR